MVASAKSQEIEMLVFFRIKVTEDKRLLISELWEGGFAKEKVDEIFAPFEDKDNAIAINGMMTNNGYFEEGEIVVWSKNPKNLKAFKGGIEFLIQMNKDASVFFGKDPHKLV